MQYLLKSKLMNASDFELILKLTLASPVFWRIKLEEWAFRISSIDTHFFRLIYFKTIDPCVNIQLLIDGREVSNFLIYYEPGILHELPGFINDPNSHCFIGARGN